MVEVGRDKMRKNACAGFGFTFLGRLQLGRVGGQHSRHLGCVALCDLGGAAGTLCGPARALSPGMRETKNALCTSASLKIKNTLFSR